MPSQNRMRGLGAFFAGLFALSILNASPAAEAAQPPDGKTRVVLLHGLARTSSSMEKMAEALRKQGFQVCNIDYPSRKYPIDTLVERFVLPKIHRCFVDSAGNTASVNFVTHSMGGILVRRLAALHPAFPIGRVVMLSPPNHGSEVVDKIGRSWLFRSFYGPAGRDLGTGSNAAPRRLGAPSFELGVVAGTRSWNPLTSWMIPGKDDGEVSLEHMKLEGMKDYVEVSATHTFIPQDDEAIRQAVEFLKRGKFDR